MLDKNYFIDSPAPYENRIAPGFEHLLSDEAKAMIAELGLTVDIQQQVDEPRMSGEIGFAGNPTLIPVFSIYHAITEEDMGANQAETIDNLKLKLDLNTDSQDPDDKKAAHIFPVYVFETAGRKHFTVCEDSAAKNSAQFAGIIYTFHKHYNHRNAPNGLDVGEFTKTIQSELLRLANFANGDYLQAIYRRDGKSLYIQEMYEKTTECFDQRMPRTMWRIKKIDAIADKNDTKKADSAAL